MNLKQIETFYWAAKLGSFIAAAKRLHTTQSAVSMRIQELERTMDTTLFDRSLRKARVTPTGHQLMKYAEELLKIQDQIQEELSAPQALAGTVRLGVSELVSLTWLPQFVMALQTKYPKIKLDIWKADSFDLFKPLVDGDLDIIFAYEVIVKPNAVIYPLGYITINWLASPNLNIPRDTVLCPKEIATHPIITLATESHSYATVDKWFKDNGTSYNCITTCNSIAISASLVKEGYGIAPLPSYCYQKEIENNELMIIKTEPKIEDVQFSAIIIPDSHTPLTKLVAQLAVDQSTFIN